jgi:hypothetical protein
LYSNSCHFPSILPVTSPASACRRRLSAGLGKMIRQKGLVGFFMSGLVSKSRWATGQGCPWERRTVSGPRRAGEKEKHHSDREAEAGMGRNHARADSVFVCCGTQLQLVGRYRFRFFMGHTAKASHTPRTRRPPRPSLVSFPTRSHRICLPSACVITVRSSQFPSQSITTESTDINIPRLHVVRQRSDLMERSHRNGQPPSGRIAGGDGGGVPWQWKK